MITVTCDLCDREIRSGDERYVELYRYGKDAERILIYKTVECCVVCCESIKSYIAGVGK